MIIVTKVRRTASDQRGSTLVEFSLVFTLVIVLLIGMADLANIVYANSTLQAAAQAGARYGLSHANDVNGIQTAVLNKLPGLEHDNVSVSSSYPSPTYPAFRAVRVRVSYQYEFIVPFIAILFGGDSISLQGGADLTM